MGKYQHRIKHETDPLNQTKAGFTLVEVILVLAIFAGILGAVYTIMHLCQRAWSNYAANITPRQELRGVLFAMGRDLREASDVFIVRDKEGLTMTFKRPVLGEIKYQWAGTGQDAHKIVRTNYAKKNILAYNISLLELSSPKENEVMIEARSGNELSLRLKGKIALRPKTGYFAQSDHEDIK